MRSRLAAIAALCLLGLVQSPAVYAQAPAPAQTQAVPPGWTQQDMNRLVEAVSDSVVRKLGEQGKAAKPASPPADAAPEASMHHFMTRIGEIGASFPKLLKHTANLPVLLDNSASGGMSFGGLIWRILLIAALALVAERVVRYFAGRFAPRLLGDDEPPPSFPRWLVMSLVEMLAIVAFWVVGNATFAALFPEGTQQLPIAGAILKTLALWRVGLAIVRCWLRPYLAQGRLAPVDDADAQSIMRVIAIATGILEASRAYNRTLSLTGAGDTEIVLQQFINAPILVGVFIFAVIALRRPVARWLDALMALQSRERWDAFIADHWHIVGIIFYIALGCALAYGGLSGRTDLPEALTHLQNGIVGWLLVETSLYAVHKRRMREKLAAGVTEPQIEDIAWRALNVLVRIAILIFLIRIIATETLNVVPRDAWAGYSAHLVGVGGVVFCAWLIWQALNFYFDRVGGPEKGPVLPGMEEAEGDDEKVEGASRLRTLIPVLRNVIGVVLLGLTALVVLSQMGVNITPLLAGASIFGLAVSFGSQSLVRDIVSGVFYLADDAFRVGEYIDIGKAKGTVESFTLRSIKLRHQSGQIHTIPFGQLGQITNFSRDYATVKFNLRFARDTDVEMLRKTSKKIGQELMEDPDLKDDFLLPLKLQGIADIQENALIARFKFTVRPGRPSYIQRLAVKRMLQLFPEKGIEFASATVAVRSVDGAPVPADLAAAATRMNTQPAPAGGT